MHLRLISLSVGDALLEKFDGEEEEANEQSRLLQDSSSRSSMHAKPGQRKFVSAGPHTDTEEEDGENETMRLLNLAKEQIAVIKDRRGSCPTEDTHV